MKEFLVDFFKRFGATVEENEGGLTVALPSGETAPPDSQELVRRFGRDRIVLVFDPHDARSGVDLVAPGGHILRTIEEFLEKRGRRSYVVAPGQKKLEKALVVEALAPAKRVKLTLEERTDEEAWDAHFTFRLRYRGRERKDALLDVMVPVRPEGIGVPRAEGPPAEAAGWESRPRKHLPEAQLKDAFARAISLVDELSVKEAIDLEARARARLERDAARLEIFYDTAVREQQTNRAPTDLARNKIEQFEEERALKRKELIEGARVEAEAEPLQLLVVERPRKRVAVRVVRPRKKGEEPAAGQVELAFDLSTGAVEPPACVACGESLAKVTACDGGHVVHEGCATPCAGCAKTVCKSCGAVPCARGDEITCPSCVLVCESCGGSVCPEHVGTCARCAPAAAGTAATRCTGCLHRCAHCGERVCEAHRLALGEETQAYLCTECGIACPGCQKTEPRSVLGRCPVCGRSFCGTCLPLKAGATACPSCR
jgi:hypothetical protein